MKLVYIANERIPSEKANSINIVKMCSSLASLGEFVTLVIPHRKNPIQTDIFAYYNVLKNFQISFLSVPETLNLGKYGFLWSQFIFSLKIFFNTNWNKKEYIIFTRDIYTSLFLSWRGYKVFHDLHGFPEKSHWFWKFVLRKMDGIVCTNEWKMKQCQDQYCIAAEKMIVARNGFDPAMFVSTAEPKTKTSLGLPADKPVVLYTGHFYDWKGAHVLAEAAPFLPGCTVVLVGGLENEVNMFTQKYGMFSNIHIVPHLTQTEIAQYLSLADVVVLPNSIRSNNPRLVVYSQYDTSPIKMFEYMACGKPMIASDLPSLREVLDETTSVFFETDNPKSLAEKIQWVLDHPVEREKIVCESQEKVKEFTWQKRAEKILTFISSKNQNSK